MGKIKYHLEKKEKDTKARLGKLETNYGTYDTPMFMPVGTRATVKDLLQKRLKTAIVELSLLILITYG